MVVKAFGWLGILIVVGLLYLSALFVGMVVVLVVMVGL